MRFTVVSKPAASRSIAVAVNSSWVSLPSAVCAWTSVEKMLSPGLSRTCAKCPSIQRCKARRPRSDRRKSRKDRPASSERAASAPHARNWRLIATGAPSISAITVAGSRLAYSAIRSTSPRAARPLSSSSAIPSVRLRSDATALAVNARETSLR